MKQIKDTITVAMRKTAGRISASFVSEEEQLRQVMRNDNAYQFLQNVLGSPSMLRNDFVLAARHFDHRLKALFKNVFVGASALGPVRHHFYKIEFQMRGSPHAHCVL